MVETSSDVGDYNNIRNNIPIEIVSDEEMALIEAAFTLASSARSSLSGIRSSSPTPSSPFLHTNALSIKSITALSKRRLSGGGGSGDIEDSPKLVDTQKKIRVPDSFLHRFRKNRGLSVTDLMKTEWCPKQMEFILLRGRPKINQAMKAGIDRHEELEEEVIKRVKVKVKSQEDYWALKFLNFINGVNQLLFEGLTRELPIIGFAKGIWMVGVIDEIRMPLTENDHNPMFIDTKTRVRDILPAEPQRRNGRLQLMSYKYLWDILVADGFPSEKFFTYFCLNPHYNLCQDLKVISADYGLSASTLDDVVRYFRNTCKLLAPAHDQLLLRYESQKDNSLLGEDKFAYDFDWLMSQMDCCLAFWLGKREATYPPEEERWKCRFCQFGTDCPAYTDIKRSTAYTSNDSNIEDARET